MAALTAGDLLKITKSAYKRVARKNTLKPDRKKRPWMRFLESIKQETSFEGGALVYPVQKSFSDDGTTWGGDDTIAATEPDFQYNMEFGYANFTTAITLKHDMLTRMGYSVIPNGDGMLEDRIKSKDDLYKIIKWVENCIEGHEDNHDRRLDELLHLPGTLSTDPVGLYGLLTLDPTTGLIGGVNRATETTARHFVDLTIAAAAAGSDMRSKMDNAMNQANVFANENGISGSIDMGFGGRAFIDAYKKWGELNNYRINRDMAEVKRMKFDFSIPDETVYFAGIPLMWDPTFEKLDTIIPATTPDYTKHLMLVNKGTFKYKVQTGRYKKLTSPPDPSNQRVSRVDIDSTVHIANEGPAANALVSLV